MDRFRRLVVGALLAGSLAGLMLFAVQHVALVPLIDVAEGFEEAAAHAYAAAGHVHEDEGWQPAPGFQRIGLTAATTMLSGIGFASVLLAAMTLGDSPVGAGRGMARGRRGQGQRGQGRHGLARRGLGFGGVRLLCPGPSPGFAAQAARRRRG